MMNVLVTVICGFLQACLNEPFDTASPQANVACNMFK